MTGGVDAPCGALAQVQKRTTKVVRLKSHRPNNTNSTIIQNGFESGGGPLLGRFLRPFQTRSGRVNLTGKRKDNSMNPLIQLKTTPPLLITLALLCFGLLPKAQATPDPGSVDPFNTADGDHALFSNTTGFANAAIGWYALFGNTTGSFNTAVGAGALDLNTGDDNTAVGTAALLLNTGGRQHSRWSGCA